MTDEELRLRLFRQQLGELLLVAACASVVGYPVMELAVSAIQDGQVTLYVGGRGGPKTPVVLTVTELPYGVAGAVLIFGSFAVGLLRLVVSPAYHALRTGVPRLGLPRVPKSLWVRRVMAVHLGAVLMFGALGAALVFVQYMAVALQF